MVSSVLVTLSPVPSHAAVTATVPGPAPSGTSTSVSKSPAASVVTVPTLMPSMKISVVKPGWNPLPTRWTDSPGDASVGGHLDGAAGVAGGAGDGLARHQEGHGAREEHPC